MENQIYNILNDMAEFLNVMQMKKLQKVLIYHLNEAKQVQEEISNEKYLEMFLTATRPSGHAWAAAGRWHWRAACPGQDRACRGEAPPSC